MLLFKSHYIDEVDFNSENFKMLFEYEKDYCNKEK